MADTLAATIWPRRVSTSEGRATHDAVDLTGAVIRDVVLCLAGAALLAISAKVVLPLRPVPMTLQTFAALCLGTAYGVWLSTLSIVAYLLCGLCGLPVFAHTPLLAAGPAYFLGPSGGFLVGLIPAAMLMGFAAENGLDRRFDDSLPCALLANAIIIVSALVWLAFAAKLGTGGHGLGLRAAWSRGIAPLFLSTAIQATLAAAIFPALWTLIGRRAAE
jgi:biotin transport system substrate-specific component